MASTIEFVEEFRTLSKEFDEIEISKGLSNDVKKSTELMKKALEECEKIIKIAGCSKKPSQEILTQMAKDIRTKIEEIETIEKKSKEIEYLNHLKALSAFAPILLWIIAPSKPVTYIENIIDSGTFYTNRVLKDCKDKGPEHKKFVTLLLGFWNKLKSHVEDFHRAGLTWNSKGCDVSECSSEKCGITSKTSQTPSSSKGGAGLTSSLFAQLNSGDNVTKGLKKVDKSMQTHKNPELRSTSVVKAVEKPMESTKKIVESNKPPVFELDDKKWKIEFQKAGNLKIDKCGLAYTVYMYKCVGTVLIIPDKINSIVLESCEKCQVLMEKGIISSFELINSKKTDIQANEVVPTISINGSDSVNIYLNEKSKNTDIVTSRSSSINVHLSTSDGSWVEYPVPEVFVSKFSGEKLLTEPVIHG